MVPMTEIDKQRIPEHVAIVMDGNGRWATSKSKPRLAGHREGAESVRAVVEKACELGVQVLTLYAFSSENWKRPEDEVSGLMSILKSFLVSELNKLLKNDIRLHCIGDISKLPKGVQESLYSSMEKTASNTRLTLNLALSYGGRDEMVHAVRELAELCAAGRITPDQITAEAVSAHLYTAGLPDPDLVIRSGGERRLSNFLLWQASYAEMYFTDVMWPDFRGEEFERAIIDFQNRERRFGKTGAQLKTG